MSKSKSKKLEFANAVILEKNGTLVLTEKDEVDENIVENYNLEDELKKFANTEHLKFTVKIGKKREIKPRAPIFKYICKCGNEIKFKSEVLKIRCLVCNEDFVKEEEE